VSIETTKNLEFLERCDKGIRREVEILATNGIETDESCEGTKGHSYSEPTVTFHGDKIEGFRALAIALQHGLKPVKLARYWSIENGEPVGPHWEMTFIHPDGGGTHPVEQGDGKIVFEWGPISR
jgi:hypothetical protein